MWGEFCGSNQYSQNVKANNILHNSPISNLNSFDKEVAMRGEEAKLNKTDILPCSSLCFVFWSRNWNVRLSPLSPDAILINLSSNFENSLLLINANWWNWDQQNKKLYLSLLDIVYFHHSPPKECELMKRVAVFSFVPSKTPLILFNRFPLL